MKKRGEKRLPEVFYLGTYRTDDVADRCPLGSCAEDVKMKYIISVVKKCNRHITVVSSLSSEKSGYHKKKTIRVDEWEDDIFLASYDTTTKGLSKIAALYRLIVIALYLLINVKEHDTLIVYNSQLVSLPIRISKKILHYKLILEVEEIFGKDSRHQKDIQREALEAKLINSADAYICASELLLNKVSNRKPGTVIYGGYTIPNKKVERYNDGNIHIVYAGGIDSLRCVQNAVESFTWLSAQYRLHILGFGSVAEINKLTNCIQKTNYKLGGNFIEFLGELHGDDYNILLQRCHIGINMQKIGESIEEYAFPSKLSSYLCCGLNIVTGKLKSVENSYFNRHVTYYCSNDPREIAKSIMNCEIESYGKQIAIAQELDEISQKEIYKVLYEEKNNM